MKKETLNNIINCFYGTYIDTDTVTKHYYEILNGLIRRMYNWKYDINDYHIKEKLNSIYGRKIFNTKENKTMTNFQWITGNDTRKEEFLNDIKSISYTEYYRKYGIKRKHQTVSADIFEWFISEYKPPKTVCVDVYKVIKFISNPALFNIEETQNISADLYTLDRYLYQKDIENDSLAIIASNIYEIIMDNTREIRRSLVEKEWNKVSKIDLDLSEHDWSGRYRRCSI